jgi:hypothetical protein
MAAHIWVNRVLYSLCGGGLDSETMGSVNNAGFCVAVSTMTATDSRRSGDCLLDIASCNWSGDEARFAAAVRIASLFTRCRGCTRAAGIACSFIVQVADVLSDTASTNSHRRDELLKQPGRYPIGPSVFLESEGIRICHGD